MLIRAARVEEAGALSALALRSKAHWGYSAEFVEACRAELTLAPDEIAARRATVVERDGGVVGFATLEGDPPEGVLGMMFVEPLTMGRGIGRLLFEHARTVARDLGFLRFTIDADPNAEAFYRAMGAVRVGSVPSGSIAGRTLPRMVVTVE